MAFVLLSDLGGTGFQRWEKRTHHRLTTLARSIGRGRKGGGERENELNGWGGRGEGVGGKKGEMERGGERERMSEMDGGGGGKGWEGRRVRWKGVERERE